jgi:23S rRNA (uracil1939-C5)-methyltransferase
LLLTIDKLIYGGEGLAHLPADASGRGKAAFVPFVLAGEQIEAAIIEQKAGFVRARVETLVEASPGRVPPACPYFGPCGGCHYQHAAYEHQLEIKRAILRESLRRTAKIELPVEIQTHPSPPWNYRNRSRLQIQTNPSFALGYFKMSSHELLAAEQCPISSPLVNRGIGVLWQSGRAGKTPQGAREIEFFANADDSELLIEIFATADARRSALRTWTEDLRACLANIAGVVVFREAGVRPSRPPEKLLATGTDRLTYKTLRASYRVSAGSFFQTNRHLTDKLVSIVTNGQSGEFALDLYAGAGLFSAALAGNFLDVVAVESSERSSADLAHNLPSNGQVVQATTEQYLAGRGKTGRTGRSELRREPDLVIVDPPRSGLGERVARRLGSWGTGRIVYVSCDPVTLARDLGLLLGAGYRIEQAHLVDLFPQTYHLESVFHLVR